MKKVKTDKPYQLYVFYRQLIHFFKGHRGKIAHLETKETPDEKNNIFKTDGLLKVNIQYPLLINFLRSLDRSNALEDIQLISSKAINIKCKTLRIKDFLDAYFLMRL